MELLGGLSFLGNIMNNRQENIKSKIKEQNPNTSGDNLFDNDTYKKSINKMKKTAKKRNRLAKNPAKTGVIPPYYNSNRSIYSKRKKFDPFDEDNDSEFSDIESYEGKSCDAGTVNLGDPTCFYRKQEEFKNNTKYESNLLEGGNNDKDSYLNQFDPLTMDNNNAPVASNSIPNMIGDNGTKRLEFEREMALNSGFSSFNSEKDQTYGIVSKENFVHNNMLPNFSSKDGGFNPYSELKNVENIQRKLDTFSGAANNLDYRPRTERKRLFDPVAGLTNLYGTPVLTNFMDARYIPGMERRNERPFQENRVTPGLNLGYNETSKAGFHDSFRVLPKTVDQLRTASNPKTTYGGVVIPGMKGNKGSIPSKMYKRKPLTFWEQTPSDYIRGQSYIKGPTIHAEVDPNNMSTVNRGVKNNGRLGGPKLFTDMHKPETLIEKSKVSLKENFKNDMPRNAHNKELTKGYVKDSINYVQDPTMRDIHNRVDRAGQAGNGELNKGYIYDGTNWIPDPNMRNLHDKTDRAGQAGNGQLNKGYIYDGTNWIPDPNMRNIHNKTDRAGQAGNAQLDKHYIYDGINWIPDPNMRNIHDKTERAGQAGNAQLDKHYIYDETNWISDPNMRNIHDKTDRAGQMGNNQLNKHHIYDGTNWIPDPNMRNIHDKIDRAGQMGNNQLNKNYIYDGTNWIPDPNMRNIHDKLDRAGQMGNKEYTKGYIYDGTNWIPDPNMRNIHDRTDRAGQVGNGEFERPYTYDETNWIPDPNMRNIHDRTDRAGQMGNKEYSKGYTYDGTNWIPDPNMRNIHDRTDRAGQVGNAQLEKQFAFDMINNIQDPTMRDIHSRYDRAGVMGANEKEKQRSRGDANNMRVNIEKEKVSQGRSPTNSSYSKGPTVNFTMMNLKEPMNFNREIYPDIQQNTTDKMGFIGTRSKQSLPQQSFRFFSFVDENLEGNPLVNNIVHKSIN